MPDAHAASYYAATANPVPDWPELTDEIETDVAIVGGGFTGAAAAVELAERGVSVALIEANRIGWGASGRNGGQITGSLSGDAAMQRAFRRRLGSDAADYVWNLRWRGHAIIADRVRKYGIRCDLRHGHVQAAWKPSHVAELEQMHRVAIAHGMAEEVALLHGTDLAAVTGTSIYPAGLVNRRNMHVHSLNLCQGEAEAAARLGARIFTGTRVDRILHGPRPELITPRGRIRARQVLIAGNCHHALGGARLAGMIFPASLGILATAPLPDDIARSVSPMGYAVYDTRFVLDYYRLSADNRLLFGSGTNYSGRATPDLASALRPAIEATFPQLRGIGIDHVWSGQDGISINRIPQLGRIRPNVFYAQAYSGHGIATSHIMAEIIAKAMTGDMQELEIFETVRHWRFPVGRRLGNLGLAVGMWYFQQMEARR